MIIDILLLVFALAGFWLGYTRGFIKTIVMVVAYIAALLLTLKFSPWLADSLVRLINIGKLPALIFGTILFLVVLIFLIHWSAKRIERSMNKGQLTKASQIFGGIVQMLMAVLVYCILLWPINQFGMIGATAKEKSLSYPTLAAMPENAKSLFLALKPVFSRYWELMETTIEDTKKAEE